MRLAFSAGEDSQATHPVGSVPGDGGDHSTRARPFGGVYVVITKIAGSRTGGLIGLLHAYPLVATTFEIVLPVKQSLLPFRA